MGTKTVAIDLAKNVFELAVADEAWRLIERKRLSRAQLQRYFLNREPMHVVMEACSTGHYWGRWLTERGMTVSLLPPHYVRAYVRRNKTDQADATALLEASRASDIFPVKIKSVEQQALQGVHRVRAAWRSTLTARINTVRGLCREFGIVAPKGARYGFDQVIESVSSDASELPEIIRTVLERMVDEIRTIRGRVQQIDAELAAVAGRTEVCKRLQKIPGVGVIAATAFAGSVGDIGSFRNARRFSSWLGLTPREFSSGEVRRLGSISKCGDRYLRMLLIHGGRAVLYSADCAHVAGRPLDALRKWALQIRARVGHNKAAVAVANKLARIVWATWHRQRDFEFRAPRNALV